ncbi:MAG: hypothetical protein ACJ76H_02560 [Bacteriovoracaceae bacterium]
MKASRINPHPVDLNDFYHGTMSAARAKEIEREEEMDEEYTEAPVPAPTFKTNLLKLRRSVSDRLFSIEFKNISF